jgi:hypothetical protein
MLREPTDHWKVAADTTHVFLLAAMFSFGIVALIFYFRVTAKLESIGESTPGPVIQPKDVFETFRKYRTLAGQNSWPVWLPRAYWIALLLAAILGMAFVYLR